jgi:hypothetical protein
VSRKDWEHFGKSGAVCQMSWICSFCPGYQHCNSGKCRRHDEDSYDSSVD